MENQFRPGSLARCRFLEIAPVHRTHPVSTAGREAGPADPGGSKTWREVRAGLRGQGLVPGGFPVPGQQLVHPGVGQLGDAGQHIGEPSLRVDVVVAIQIALAGRAVDHLPE